MYGDSSEKKVLQESSAGQIKDVTPPKIKDASVPKNKDATLPKNKDATLPKNKDATLPKLKRKHGRYVMDSDDDDDDGCDKAASNSDGDVENTPVKTPVVEERTPNSSQKSSLSSPVVASTSKVANWFLKYTLYCIIKLFFFMLVISYLCRMHSIRIY